MRVLVTDGENRAALAVTRSLGRLGHEVVVAERRSPSLAQASRYCAGSVVYPDPARNEDAFIRSLVSELRRRGIEVLNPISDITTSIVTARRDCFEPACHVPFADSAAIDRASDKVEVLRLAESLGVPVPPTVVLDDPASLGSCLPRMSFPVVIKPRRSRIRTPEGWIATGVRYASDPAALAEDVTARHPLEFPLLLQERIAGYGMGIFACYDHGSLRALFSHRRLREKPPSGGVSVLAESIEASPRARRYAEALLNELGWHGVAMVEFKVDCRNQVPVLMEINARFWGSLQLAIDAGVDFPAVLLETLRCERPASASLPSYRVGVKSRWLWGDLDSLLLELRHPASHGNGNGNGWPRLRAIGRFLRMWEKGLRYENPRLSDLRPWLYETRHRIRPR